MIGIEMRFLSGTYHATPWQRHVNEAEIEWPPSPWRVLRALIAVWYRKALYQHHSEAVLRTLVEHLSADLPVYVLPEVVHAHSRHYMPISGGKTTLVYDGFLRIDVEDTIQLGWEGISLSKAEKALFTDLALQLGYLGRSESWVEGRVIEAFSKQPNCIPLGAQTKWVSPSQEPPSAGTKPPETDEVESTMVMVPMSLAEYQGWRSMEALQTSTKQRKNSYSEELPVDVFGALLTDTNDLQAAGRLQPPGAKWVVYERPLLANRSLGNTTVVRALRDNVARYALTSKPRPSIGEALEIAEVMHMALLDKYGQGAPTLMSGREENGAVSERGHEHLFILPEDEDGDGYIDHVLIHSPLPLAAEVLHAMERLEMLHTPSWWPGRERRWHLFLEGTFDLETAVGTVGGLPKILQSSSRWVSQTPYLHPWHRKRNKFGAEEQIRRELRLRGLPDPIKIAPMETLRVHGRTFQTHDFQRVRRSKRQRLPDDRGGFWEIEFTETTQGPLALGSNCHFGMGLFVPAGEN